jgi:hypothetical protein
MTISMQFPWGVLRQQSHQQLKEFKEHKRRKKTPYNVVTITNHGLNFFSS